MRHVRHFMVAAASDVYGRWKANLAGKSDCRGKMNALAVRECGQRTAPTLGERGLPDRSTSCAVQGSVTRWNSSFRPCWRNGLSYRWACLPMLGWACFT